VENIPDRCFILGDEHDLGLIFAMCAQLPPQTSGAVVLELSRAKRPPLELPDSMMLTVLPRLVPFSAESLWSARNAHPSAARSLDLPAASEPRPGPTLPRGERAAAALLAFADEWLLPEDPAASDRALWVGMVGVPAVDEACDRLARSVRHLHMHRPTVVSSPDVGR
jgi:hypothetical protein